MAYIPPVIKPAPSFGGVQQDFHYRLRSFLINDQFTIVEDLPRNKPIRQAFKQRLNAKPGEKDSYQVFLVKISSNGFTADLELFDTELNTLAIACPKETQNFKGVTLAFDGRRWVYIGGEMPYVGNQPQDPRQPNLYPPQEQLISQPQDQTKVFIDMLVDKMKKAKEFAIELNHSRMTGWADKISPGNADNLIKAAKDAGMITESMGLFEAR